MVGNFYIPLKLKEVPRLLAKFEAEMQQVRKDAPKLFPDIWEDTAGRSEYHRQVRTLYFAMTQGEDQILEVMRKKLTEKGHRVDALTGDGLLVRPNEVFGPQESFGEMLREIEVAVAIETGFKVRLSGKTLDGEETSRWSDTQTRA